MFSAVSEEKTKTFRLHSVSRGMLAHIPSASQSEGEATFLIASQDPDFDASLGQVGNGLWNSILKFILNGGCSNQLKTTN